MGNGETTLFWLEDWETGGCLSKRFPLLYNLEKRKGCHISDRITYEGFKGVWKKKSSSLDELDELHRISAALANTQLSNQRDRWVCPQSTNGFYQVGETRRAIDEANPSGVQNIIIWTKLVPSKVNCFVWRASLNRMPTAIALSQRGAPNIPTSCQFCPDGMEDTMHLLVTSQKLQ